MDAGTGDVRAVEFTSSRQGDSPLLPDLLAQIPPEETIGTVTADGAYDTRRCHGAIIDRGAQSGHTDPSQRSRLEERLPRCHRAKRDLRATRHLGRARGRDGRNTMSEVGSRRA